jgi:hypothetical protein
VLLTLAAQSPNQIDGVISKLIGGLYRSATVVTDGSNWWLLAD